MLWRGEKQVATKYVFNDEKDFQHVTSLHETKCFARLPKRPHILHIKIAGKHELQYYAKCFQKIFKFEDMFGV